jgi:ELWxxDGT repeat protein
MSGLSQARRVSIAASFALLLTLLAASACAAQAPALHRIKDIRPGSSGSNPGPMTRVAGKGLFFAANDGTHGRELWMTKGSTATTALVRSIRAGNDSSSPRELTSAGGELLFAANDGTHGTELWRSDGTAAGTKLVRDIRAGSIGSAPHELTNVGGTLFFAAHTRRHGTELWRSDGTAAGTTMVKDLDTGQCVPFRSNFPGCSSDPYDLTAVGGKLFFAADNINTYEEVYVSDGTAAGTKLLKDIANCNPDPITNPFCPAPGGLTDVGGTLFFVHDDGSCSEATCIQLWKSDGTPTGTKRVKDICDSQHLVVDNPSELADVGGGLYFAAADAAQGTDCSYASELWTSNGTAAGTKKLRTFDPAGSPEFVHFITEFGSQAYFVAEDGTARGLYRSNGTAAGTKLVKDVNIVGAPGTVGLKDAEGTLYFAADDASHGTELWFSDGTGAGTKFTTDLNPGTADSAPQNLASVGKTLYFSATNGSTGREIYKAVP